jgi:hypothetical protein
MPGLLPITIAAWYLVAAPVELDPALSAPVPEQKTKKKNKKKNEAGALSWRGRVLFRAGYEDIFQK